MSINNQRGYTKSLFALLFTLMISILATVFSYVQCNSRWEDSGLKHSFGIVAGCRVQLLNGRWVPEDRVRETDITSKTKE